MSKERKCGSCAWWRQHNPTEKTGEGWNIEGSCHYEPRSYNKYEDDWCRHWSETTGWDVFEKQPDPAVVDLQEQLRLNKGLLRLAAELFERDLEYYQIKHMSAGVNMSEVTDIGIREKWLEEYKTKC